MSLVLAKCPNCGANININDDAKAGVCEHCGTAFVTEEAINNYNITNNNTYNIQNATINMNEKKPKMENIRFFIGSSPCSYCNSSIDILVDGITCATTATTKMSQLVDVLIDVNKQHRIQCVISNSSKQKKSNVLFVDIGQTGNVYIEMLKIEDYVEHGTLNLKTFDTYEEMLAFEHKVQQCRSEAQEMRKK